MIAKPVKVTTEFEKYEILKKRENILMQVQDYIDSFLNPNKDSYIENTTTEEVLKLLEIKQDDYYWALGRDTRSCFVNNYNSVLLKAWRANIDLQPVTNYYKAVAHMTAYISTSEHGASEAMSQAEKKIKVKKKNNISHV